MHLARPLAPSPSRLKICIAPPSHALPHSVRRPICETPPPPFQSLSVLRAAALPTLPPPPPTTPTPSQRVLQLLDPLPGRRQLAVPVLKGTFERLGVQLLVLQKPARTLQLQGALVGALALVARLAPQPSLYLQRQHSKGP